MRMHRLALAALATLTVSASGLLAEAPPSFAHLGYSPGPTSVFGERCIVEPCGGGQFSEAVALAVNEATGDVYVIDEPNNRVEEFDSEGKYVGQFNGSGTLPNEGKAAGGGGLAGEKPTGRFSSPVAVAVENSKGPAGGDVYVADRGNDVIDVFSASGKYLSQITAAGFAELQEIATDPYGNLFVDDGFRHLYEFSEKDTLITKFELAFAIEGQMAVDATDDIYFKSGGAVKEIDHEGKPLGEFGSQVRGLTVDAASGSSFVDSESSIEEFASNPQPGSEPAATFGVEGLEYSNAIAINGANGTVYANDSKVVSGGVEEKIDVFKLVLLPGVSGGAATGVGATAARISADVQREGLPTKYRFQYGETIAYGSNSAVVAAVGEEEEVSADLTGLQPATTYHYRLVAENENGPAYTKDGTFTTAMALATVNDQAPTISSVTRTTALVRGTVDDEHDATDYHVEYVDAGGYAPGAPNPYANGGGSEIVALEPTHGDQSIGPIGLEGLLAGTTYHYRLVASNGAGTTYGPDYTFTTAPATPPSASTGPAGEVTQTGVLLNGAVGTEELQTSYEFEVGTDTSYGGAKLFGNAGRNGTEAVSASLLYLIPGTTYHYRLVATNEDGTSYGQDMTFTTPGVAAIIVQPAALAMVASPSVTFPSPAGAITKAQGSGKRSKQKAKPGKRKAKRGKRAKRKRATGHHHG